MYFTLAVLISSDVCSNAYDMNTCCACNMLTEKERAVGKRSDLPFLDVLSVISHSNQLHVRAGNRRIRASLLLFPISFLLQLILSPQLLICQVVYFHSADYQGLTQTHAFSFGAIGLFHQLVPSAFSSVFSALVP